MKRVKKPSRPEFFPMPLGSSGAGWHQISSLASTCPKEYQFSQVRKVRRAERYIRRPLSVGMLLHAARAQWFYDSRQGTRWQEAMIRYKKQVEEAEGERLAPGALDEALRVFKAYTDYWKLRPSEWTEVLAVEHYIPPRLIFPGAPAWATRTVRMDSIERWRGKTWIGEAKSVYAGGRSRLGDMYELHGQILLACTLWGPEETERFGPLAGVLLDPMVKGSGTRRPTGAPRIEQPIAMLKHALDWFKRDMLIWLDNAQMVDWDADVPRTMNCMRSYGPCEYRDLCKSGRNGALSYVLADGSPLLSWRPSPTQKKAPWE